MESRSQINSDVMEFKSKKDKKSKKRHNKRLSRDASPNEVQPPEIFVNAI